MDITTVVICEHSSVSDRQWQLTWYYTNAEIFHYITTKYKIKKYHCIQIINELFLQLSVRTLFFC